MQPRSLARSFGEKRLAFARGGTYSVPVRLMGSLTGRQAVNGWLCSLCNNRLLALSTG
jgi:hypothetical protein